MVITWTDKHPYIHTLMHMYVVEILLINVLKMIVIKPQTAYRPLRITTTLCCSLTRSKLLHWENYVPCMCWVHCLWYISCMLLRLILTILNFLESSILQGICVRCTIIATSWASSFSYMSLRLFVSPSMAIVITNKWINAIYYTNWSIPSSVHSINNILWNYYCTYKSVRER